MIFANTYPETTTLSCLTAAAETLVIFLPNHVCLEFKFQEALPSTFDHCFPGLLMVSSVPVRGQTILQWRTRDGSCSTMPSMKYSLATTK